MTDQRASEQDQVGTTVRATRSPERTHANEPVEDRATADRPTMVGGGAGAKAVVDRLKTELDRTWERALSARQRRDALLARQRQLVADHRAASREMVGDESLGSASPMASPGGPEWVVATMKAELFKALGHPARVRALELLTEGERSVGWLTEALSMEISHLSHHLAVLRRSGLVDSRREGSIVYYWLRQPQFSQILALVAAEMLWDAALDPG